MECRRLPAAASFLALLALLGETPPKASATSIFPDQCGTMPAVDEIATGTRIIGGRDAQLGAWPWQISLQIYQFGIGFHHVCGGSLINHNTVVTAAHCFKLLSPELWRVVIGIHHLYKAEPHVVASSISNIMIHSDYSKHTNENDIALLSLSQAIQYNDYIQPICLPGTSLKVTKEYLCYIAGWGHTDKKDTRKYILQEAQVNIIPLKICNKRDWYGGRIKMNMICAGYENGSVNSCKGDSGGPLMCYFPDASKYYLIGITSFGSKCGQPKKPAVYTLVPNYKHWLDVHLVSHKITPVSIPYLLIFWTVGWLTLYLLL
ncbi:hypothetical protein lerEdw1_001624 [Lerista edwardsae]|nr:hypothetical protein lerEdw1_001624 [Lerista edwardsae]